MKDFPIVWLLVNTKTGKVILGLLVDFVIVGLVSCSPSPKPMETEEVAEEDTSTWEPPGDTAIFSEPVKSKAVKSVKSTKAASSRSYSSGSDDGMRGFYPASEDDMDDNGMSRYMEANDDERWD